MKQPAYNLHWQLLPYDQRRSKRFLHFDVAFPVDDIVFQGRGYRTKLTEAELIKAAADFTMTTMLISFEKSPFSWEVDVRNARGITCRDVFEAIYKTFDEQLTPDERRLVPDRRAVEDAFKLRCRLTLGLPEVERSLGWKRVDVLLHRTVFLGLAQPKSEGDYVLNLGLPPNILGGVALARLPKEGEPRTTLDGSSTLATEHATLTPPSLRLRPESYRHTGVSSDQQTSPFPYPRLSRHNPIRKTL